MPDRRKFRPSHEVLRYTMKGSSRSTVLRHYLRWRSEQDPPLPIRCDNPLCFFYDNPLIWNGQPFKPILDHVEGNNSDNRPEMLRLLCPNCDSQLPTRGGANKGRIKKSEGGFAKVSPDGKRNYVLPVEPGVFAIAGQDAELKIRKAAVQIDAQPIAPGDAPPKGVPPLS